MHACVHDGWMHAFTQSRTHAVHACVHNMRACILCMHIMHIKIRGGGVWGAQPPRTMHVCVHIVHIMACIICMHNMHACLLCMHAYLQKRATNLTTSECRQSEFVSHAEVVRGRPRAAVSGSAWVHHIVTCVPYANFLPQLGAQNKSTF